MHLFKKKKTSKGLIEGLSEYLSALPTAERIEECVRIAVENAEAVTVQSSRVRTVTNADAEAKFISEPSATVVPNSQSYSASGILTCSSQENSASFQKSVLIKPDCFLGISEGLSFIEINALDNVEKRLVDLVLFIDNKTEGKEEDYFTLVKLCLEENIIMQLLEKMASMTFIARDEAAKLMADIVTVQQPVELVEVVSQYVSVNSRRIVELLISSYLRESISLLIGLLFRKFLLHESVYMLCLNDDMKVLNAFLDTLLLKGPFERVSDAFTTFREILQGQRQLVANFLDVNYEKVFPRYNELLISSEYVTQRQSLKLLSDLLLDRQNYKVMIRYIGEKANLVLIMSLMRVKSPSMRLEAFHVFKIFVANPNKTEPVLQLLQKNKEKLIAYLSKLTTEREEEIFVDERKLVVRTLENLPPLEEDVVQLNDVKEGEQVSQPETV